MHWKSIYYLFLNFLAVLFSSKMYFHFFISLHACDWQSTKKQYQNAEKERNLINLYILIIFCHFWNLCAKLVNNIYHLSSLSSFNIKNVVIQWCLHILYTISFFLSRSNLSKNQSGYVNKQISSGSLTRSTSFSFRFLAIFPQLLYFILALICCSCYTFETIMHCCLFTLFFYMNGFCHVSFIFSFFSTKK